MKTNTKSEAKAAPEPTAILRVGFFTSVTQHGQPSGTCDRCGTGIKYVFSVAMKDGSTYNYGSECIHKVLAGDNSLKSLWSKNAKQLARLQKHIEILNLPLDQMPTEREYCNSGIYIITDGEGHTINGSKSGCIIFHPNVDLDRKAASPYAFKPESTADYWDYTKNVRVCGMNTPEFFNQQCLHKIEEAKAYIQSEISRIEPFLARILAKGLAGQQTKPT